MTTTKTRLGRNATGGAAAIQPDQAQRWARRLAAKVTAVMARHPEADPDDVRLTLIALRASPLDRLNRSLRRGRGFAAFRK